jgi:hypothetical protein
MGKILLKKKPNLNFNIKEEIENDIIIPDNIKPIIEKAQTLQQTTESVKNNFITEHIQGFGLQDLKKINFDNIVKNKNKKNIRLILN